MRHEVKQPLRLENGKFMRGEVEVPIEIGNAEQIALLQKIERDMRIREKDAKAGKRMQRPGNWKMQNTSTV